MGACFDTATLFDEGVPLLATQVKEKFAGIVDECRYLRGHGGYTGTFAECDGLKFTVRSFTEWEEAWEWLEQSTEKWEAAKAVRVNNPEKPGWAIGAWCSS